jgi:hypothetical protein
MPSPSPARTGRTAWARSMPESTASDVLASLSAEQRDLCEEAVTRAICEELDRLIEEGRKRLAREAAAEAESADP